MRQTDKDAFEAAFRTLFPRAFRLAFRILGNSAAAEDVAAEALARCYAHWREVQYLTYREAWVLRVAANLAIQTARRPVAAPDPAAAVDVAEMATLRAALTAALRALPRRQREVVVLRYLAGLSEAEVASALNLSQGTVKSHIHRGLMALRGRLGQTPFGAVTNDGN